MKILITGASGNIGGKTLHNLSESPIGHTLVAASRHPENLEAPSEVEKVKLDYKDSSTFDSALEGIDVMFLVSPPVQLDSDQYILPFLDKAKEKGVKKVVLLSAMGANQNPAGPLYNIEQKIQDEEFRYSFLRPTFFMENFSEGAFSYPIKSDGVIALPAEKGKISFIASDDIAQSAVVALTTDKADDTGWELTGPVSMDHHEAAEKISVATGKNVKYVPIKQKEMDEAMKESGADDSSITYMNMLFSAVRDGHTDVVTRAVSEITGKEPTSFDKFAEQNRQSWI